MGLDMYLVAKRRGEKKQDVAYWRKANAIHAWFVQHVQCGVDDCGEYDVSRTQLYELRTLCKKVLDNSKLIPSLVQNGERLVPGGSWERIFEPGKIIEDPSVAMELLPTQDGFFFGSDNYDENYYRKLQSTVEQINKGLETFGPDYTFYYHSSW